MTNEEFEEKVSAYVDEELSPIGRADMERKAAESEACRVLLKDVKALKDRLARLPQAQPSAGFNFALRSHLLIEIARDQRMSRRIRRVFFGSAMRSVASLAAAVVLGLGLSTVFQGSGQLSQVGQVASENVEFQLMPAQPAPLIDHRGALELLSQNSHRLDGKLYRDGQDSGRVDSVLNRPQHTSPWLQNQGVQQVPVSF